MALADAEAPIPLDAFAPDGAALAAPLDGAGAVTDAPALGVAGDGVIVDDGVVGAGVVTVAPGLVAAAFVLSVDFAGSAIEPGDVVTVVPLTPAFFEVSGCVVLASAFFEVSGCVVCCAAAGIDIAASSTAASVYRCFMVGISCIRMLWVFRPPFDGQQK